MTRAMLAAIAAVVLLAATAHGAQCNCPAPPEPVRTPAPVVTAVPWTARVWLPWVGNN